MDYEFTIIVPVYNEEDNLLRVEKELLKYNEIALCLRVSLSRRHKPAKNRSNK